MTTPSTPWRRVSTMSADTNTSSNTTTATQDPSGLFDLRNTELVQQAIRNEIVENLNGIRQHIEPFESQLTTIDSRFGGLRITNDSLRYPNFNLIFNGGQPLYTTSAAPPFTVGITNPFYHSPADRHISGKDVMVAIPPHHIISLLNPNRTLSTSHINQDSEKALLAIPPHLLQVGSVLDFHPVRGDIEDRLEEFKLRLDGPIRDVDPPRILSEIEYDEFKTHVSVFIRNADLKRPISDMLAGDFKKKVIRGFDILPISMPRINTFTGRVRTVTAVRQRTGSGFGPQINSIIEHARLGPYVYSTGDTVSLVGTVLIYLHGEPAFTIDKYQTAQLTLNENTLNLLVGGTEPIRPKQIIVLSIIHPSSTPEIFRLKRHLLRSLGFGCTGDKNKMRLVLKENHSVDISREQVYYLPNTLEEVILPRSSLMMTNLMNSRWNVGGGGVGVDISMFNEADRVIYSYRTLVPGLIGITQLM